MNDEAFRPPHLNLENASRFKQTSVAEQYENRAPYSAEVIDTLLGLMAPDCPIVLDAGCGPGKLARDLAPNVERVDAVDFSAEMIRVGKQQNGGDHPHIFWQCSPIETAELQPKYGLIVAGASMHWMDWDVVLPKFGRHLAADGVLAIVNGDAPVQADWSGQRRALIIEYSAMQNFRSFNLVDELVKRKLFELKKIQVCKPVEITQSVDDFLKAEHSRSSLSIEAMTPKRAAEFDEKFRAILKPYSTNNTITYPVSTTITWGKPI